MTYFWFVVIFYGSGLLTVILAGLDFVSRQFKACLAPVYNRGTPPGSFLDQLIEWARQAPDSIFAPNDVPVDIFTVIKPALATQIGSDPVGGKIVQWESLLHRKAALCEAMRVHAGMESSWKWNEGVDVTNKRSVASLAGQETGIFQVSFDSTNIAFGAMKPFARERGINTIANFISKMKSNHPLALEYYARLSRISIRWAGPLLRHGNDSVYPWLSRASVAEFQTFLA